MRRACFRMIASYTVPASIFMMSVRGTAELGLDCAAHTVLRMNIFHAGKGALLDIQAGTGLSPIDYLIKVRVDKAAALLLDTDASLTEIAAGVGYQDPYYLGRLFKKHKGISPSKFKAERAAKRKAEDCPSPSMRSSIVSPDSLDYTFMSDNDYHLTDGGELNMFTESKTPIAKPASFRLSKTARRILIKRVLHFFQ